MQQVAIVPGLYPDWCTCTPTLCEKTSTREITDAKETLACTFALTAICPIRFKGTSAIFAPQSTCRMNNDGKGNNDNDESRHNHNVCKN